MTITEPTLKKRGLKERLNRVFLSNPKRDMYPTSEYMLKEERYKDAFNKFSEKDLEEILNRIPQINWDKQVLWFIEHCVDNYDKDPIFLIDKKLSTFANHELVVPFSNHALNEGIQISSLTRNIPTSKLFERDYSGNLFLHYLPSNTPEELIPKLDFGFCGEDCYLGQSPRKKVGNTDFTVTSSCGLIGNLERTYKQIMKNTKEYRKLITKSNYQEI